LGDAGAEAFEAVGATSADEAAAAWGFGCGFFADDEVDGAFLCGEAAATTGFFAAGGVGCSPLALPGPSDAAAAAETTPRREEERRSSSDAAFALACWRRSVAGDEGCLAGACRPEVLAPAPPRVVCVALHRNSARSIVDREKEKRRLLFPLSV
jgi:hypothetical protein